MSATDELRRLLDGRGVEWDELVGHPVVVGTEWHDRYGCPCTALEHADDVPDGMLSVQANLTPEQAIEATLGRETCEILGYDDGYDEGVDGEMYQYVDPRYFLSCEHEAYGSIPPNYCPVCGRKVVDE